MLEDVSDRIILILTIYGEARGESIEGQIAVGCVIRNRVLQSSKNEIYRDICLAPKQFSCWNKDDPNYQILISLAEKMMSPIPDNSPIIRQISWIAVGIMNKAIVDVTGGSTHYMTSTLYAENAVTWAYKMKVSKVIGNQTFLV
jgi:cell wall hydrolase